MPIEIRELIIKGTIGGGQNQSGQPTGSGEVSDKDKQEIISMAVDKVLEILKDKKNR